MMFKKVAIIGIGLIGSSIAHKVNAAKLAKETALYDASETVRVRAAELGLGVVYDNYTHLLHGAELVIICTPSGVIASVAQEIMQYLDSGAILSDVGSVKGEIIKQIAPHLRDDVYFIPAHPIAGTEFSGPDAGFAELFENRWSIICPIEDERKEYLTAVEKLSGFWKDLSANVEIMNAERHDMALAMTSHIPHLIAFTIVTTAEDIENVTESDVVKYSAGGFRDFTRIAASDPTMWRDVFILNKDAILEILGRFSEDLTALRRAIRWEDGQTLFDTITRARRMRKEVIDAGQDINKPNFGR
jgi:cyclohexadieny/prephenate dehydrogenase